MEQQVEFKVINKIFFYILFSLMNTTFVVGSYEKLLFGFEYDLKSDDDSLKSKIIPIFSVPAHTSKITSIACSKGNNGSSNAKNEYLATGSSDETIQIFDLRNRRELGAIFPQIGCIEGLFFSTSTTDNNNNNNDDNTPKYLLALGSDNKLAIIRTSDWEIIVIISSNNNASSKKSDDSGSIVRYESGCLAVHPSNRLAVSLCGRSNTLSIYDLVRAKVAGKSKLCGPEKIAKLFAQNIVVGKSQWHRLCWSPKTGQYLLAVSDYVVALFDPNTLDCVQAFIASDSDCRNQKKRFTGAAVILDNNEIMVGRQDGSIMTLNYVPMDEKNPSSNRVLMKESSVLLTPTTTRVKDLKVVSSKSLISIDSNGMISLYRLEENQPENEVKSKWILSDQYDLGCRLTCLDSSS